MNKQTLTSRLITTITAGAVLLGALPAASTGTAHASMIRDSGLASMDVRPATPGSTAEVLQLRVEISYRGWNGNPEFSIEAEEGQQVEITFVWADSAVPDNAHRIRIEGYGLSTPLLDSENPEYTLKFIANRTGTFELLCDWRCEGHKEALADAKLVVNGRADTGGQPDPGAGPALQPTSMLLVPSSSTVDAGPVTLRVELLDEAQQPVVDAPVRFFLSTSFAGTAGEMEIGLADTDASGVASIEFTPRAAGEYDIMTRFAGQGLYGQTEQVQRINVVNPSPAYLVADKGLNGIRHLGTGHPVLAPRSSVGNIWLRRLSGGSHPG